MFAPMCDETSMTNSAVANPSPSSVLPGGGNVGYERIADSQMSNEGSPSPTIIVGVDGAESTLKAVEWAAHFAEKTSSRLVLLHVVSRALWSFLKAATADPEVAGAALTDDAQPLLDAAAEVAQLAAPGVVVERRIVEGRPVDTYLKESADARLLVIDAAEGAGSPILHGHITGIISGATCPVLAWRSSSDRANDVEPTIVVGVDESASAAKALEVAFATADVLRLPLTVAHMWETDAAVGLGYAAGPTNWDLVRVLRAEQESKIADFLEPLVKKYRRVDVRITLVENSPAKGLVDLSESAALVVVGSNGRGRIANAVLGSVTQNVVHHSHAPVLVVPG